MRITWVGHSTVLVELDGVRLLTDPLLRERVLHLRRVEPVDRALIGDVDAVLVSHLHYDHLDLPSLRELGTSLPLVLPRGAARMLRRRGFEHAAELAPGEETRIGVLSVRATHAEHGGGRGLFGPEIPAVGYFVSGTARVYFAGDTDLFEGMSALAPSLDVALLPVGGWGSRLPPGHLDPRRAAEALRRLNPRFAVPIHWGTYRQLGLSHEPAVLRKPAEEFERLAGELAPAVDVRIVPPGGSIELPVATSLET